MWHENILGAIGNTPLVRLHRTVTGVPCTVLAKVEFLNPGGSVKDRIGVAMIEEAEKSGELTPGGTIVEGTSGNTGAGLALVAIAKGYKCIFTTTDKQSQEKIDVLRALGAEVLVCPTNVHAEDPRSYYQVARRLAREIPGAVYVNQYENLSNTEAHYRTTGPELWEQTEGRITHFILGAGTGGTITGAGRYLKEKNPNIKIIGVDPYGSVYYKYFHTREFDEKEIHPYITEGVGEDILAGNMDFDVVDDYVRVTDKESMQMTRRISREEGLFVGGSSGMAVVGALQWLHDHREDVKQDDVVVVLLPDGGFRYLSKIFNDNWMRDHGFLERPPDVTVEHVLRERKSDRRIINVEANDTLAEAISRMSRHGISQLPVVYEGEIVGSLTETGILTKLIEEPTARERPVREMMSPPFPIVPKNIHLEHLYAYLDNNAGAVMVHTDEEGGFEIITRSDLISILAEMGRKGVKNGNK